MSGDGGNPPSLRDLLGAYEKSGLGHRVADMHGRAYNRTEFIADRREMMQSWANYLDDLKKTNY
jgi:predicted Zn-dependent protease with MMP-like domain